MYMLVRRENIIRTPKTQHNNTEMNDELYLPGISYGYKVLQHSSYVITAPHASKVWRNIAGNTST